MYEAVSTSTVRLTVGTEQIGLTYYLSRAKLEHLNLGNEETEQLEDLGLVPGKPKEWPEDSYHLERSFLMWLDLAKQDSGYLRERTSYWRSPPLSLNRIHDWTFRLHLEESGKLQHLLDPGELIDHVEYFSYQWILSRIPEWLAMSAAAFVYGGLHLLAWNAPFHAPIYGLLWKTSGITIASLVVFPFLILFFLVCDTLRWGDSKPLKGLFSFLAILILVCMLSFILLYIFARVYLVVESFPSLAYLPESVMVTPNFSLYFPHVG